MHVLMSNGQAVKQLYMLIHVTIVHIGGEKDGLDHGFNLLKA